MRHLAALIAVIAGCVAAPAIAQPPPRSPPGLCKEIVFTGLMGMDATNVVFSVKAQDPRELARQHPFTCANWGAATRFSCHGLAYMVDQPGSVVSRGSGILVVMTTLSFPFGSMPIPVIILPETAACRSGPPAD